MKRSTYARIGLLTLVFVMLLAGCKPYKGTTVVQIAPNQTAFLLPAQGDTTQQSKFDSVDYLRNNQVAAKVVEISFREHKTGRIYWDIDFVPNQILVIVDRNVEARQWMYNQDNTLNQAIGLESQESIGFYHSVVVNAVIEEVDTATFLYYYGGAGLQQDASLTGIQLTVGLDHVLDTYVRNWVAERLYAEFKALPLDDCQIQAANIFLKVEEEAIANFKKYGITILDLGGIEGLVYDDDEVQDTINQKFNVESKATAQAVTNQQNVDQANAQATVTVLEANAEAEAIRLTGEQLAAYPSIVNKILAEKSQGAVPSVLVMNSDDQTGTMPFPFWFYYPNQPADTSGVPTSATPTLAPTTAP